MKNSELMVEYQLKSRGIKDEKVLRAFGKIRRELFVDPRFAADAYGDRPLPIGEGQTISQPYIVAKMTELLDVGKDMRVLEIGTGSGYQTAILAELAKEVFTIERHPALLENAKNVLSELNYLNIKFKTGDGTLGWEENSPYDRIIVTAATPDVPPLLFEQLKEFGKIVLPVGERYHQRLAVVTKKSGSEAVSYFDECIFVPLIGKHGFHK